MAGQGKPTEKRQAKDRVEAHGFIVCRFDELRQTVASHGLVRISVQN
jgi:hypothetical protein